MCVGGLWGEGLCMVVVGSVRSTWRRCMGVAMLLPSPSSFLMLAVG
jgi:hypothetical protein